MKRQKRRVKADGTQSGSVAGGGRNEHVHIRHNHQVGIVARKPVKRLPVIEVPRLVNRKAPLKREFPDRIHGSAVGLAVDRHDLVHAGVKEFGENVPAKRLLTHDHDA